MVTANRGERGMAVGGWQLVTGHHGRRLAEAVRHRRAGSRDSSNQRRRHQPRHQELRWPCHACTPHDATRKNVGACVRACADTIVLYNNSRWPAIAVPGCDTVPCTRVRLYSPGSATVPGASTAAGFRPRRQFGLKLVFFNMCGRERIHGASVDPTLAAVRRDTVALRLVPLYSWQA